MAHPSTYLIRYLLVRGWPNQENVTTVNDTLEDLGLPTLTERQFDRILFRLNPPKELFVNNKNHLKTAKFMRDERIYSLWCPTKDEKAAFEFNDHPQMREVIQILLMGRLDSAEISLRVERKFKKSLTPKSIDAYSHFFWNVKLASYSEWMEILAEHPLRDHYVASLFGSKAQALYRAGFSPAIDSRKALAEAHRAAVMRIEATRSMPDAPNTANVLSSYTGQLIHLNDALYGDGAGAEEAMRELRKFKMLRNAEPVKPLAHVAPNSNYSDSGKGTTSGNGDT